MQFRLPFSEIPESGVEYEIRDSSWFPEQLAEQAGPAVVIVRLTKKNDNRIELQGNLKVKVALKCDRCLGQFEWLVHEPMQLLIEVVEEKKHWRLRGLEYGDSELETVSLDKPVVNLAELFREQLFLSLPEKKLCMDNCRGLCPHCGADLNKQSCRCPTGPGTSPFAVLGKLKKK